MRSLLRLGLLCWGWAAANGQTVSLLDAVSGAPNPNDASTREIRIYSNRSVPKGSLAVVTATWSCPSLEATLDDNLGDKYQVLSGPTVSGPLRVEHWYTITRVDGPAYLAPRVLLNGTCSADGRAFNSLYLQLGIFSGVDSQRPVDLASVASRSGDQANMIFHSAEPGPAEMLIAIVVTAGVGAPFKLSSGWMPWLAGEAVAANAYRYRWTAATEEFAAAASSASAWSGLIFGVRAAPGKTGAKRATSGVP